MMTDKKNVEEKEDKIKQFVTFWIVGERYAVDIMQTQGINKIEMLTPIPNSMDFVEGVINLRGDVIPIINLKKRFNLVDNEEEESDNIIVILLDDMILGVKIDGISRVISLPQSRIFPPPPVVAGIGREYISGVGRDEENKLLIILDINKLLSYEEIEAIKDAK